MQSIAALLAQSSERSDLTTFFKAQVLFWMLRAIDGHAKNFSLFLKPGGRFQLTPLYDVLSAWPCLLYTSPSPRDVEESRMPSSA